MTISEEARNDPFLSLRGVIAVARRSRSKLEHEIPRFTRNKLRNLCPAEIATPWLPRFARNFGSPQ